jgi:hypothetical protein
VNRRTFLGRHNCELEPCRHRDDAYAGQGLYALWTTEGVFKIQGVVVERRGRVPGARCTVIPVIQGGFLIPPSVEPALVCDDSTVPCACRNTHHPKLAQLAEESRHMRSRKCITTSPPVHLALVGEGEAVRGASGHAPHAYTGCCRHQGRFRHSKGGVEIGTRIQSQSVVEAQAPWVYRVAEVKEGCVARVELQLHSTCKQ